VTKKLKVNNTSTRNLEKEDIDYITKTLSDTKSYRIKIQKLEKAAKELPEDRATLYHNAINEIENDRIMPLAKQLAENDEHVAAVKIISLAHPDFCPYDNILIIRDSIARIDREENEEEAYETCEIRIIYDMAALAYANSDEIFDILRETITDLHTLHRNGDAEDLITDYYRKGKIDNDATRDLLRYHEQMEQEASYRENLIYLNYLTNQLYQEIVNIENHQMEQGLSDVSTRGDYNLNEDNQ